MPEPPRCARMGRHCRELRVTLRIADLADDSRSLQDAAATWLLGHTQRITFGKPFVRDAALLVDATIHVPCKYLKSDGAPTTTERRGSTAHCAAHGFRGPMPAGSQPAPEERPDLRRANGAFQVFYKGRQRKMPLPLKGAARRALPVLNGDNPCATAACRTADNTRGAACCRDLTLDVLVPKWNGRLAALLRARKSPYLCKVTREDEDAMECEVISACGYLDPGDGVSCTLHDRILPNGRLAKPSICREWPDLDEDEIAHPGCVLSE